MPDNTIPASNVAPAPIPAAEADPMGAGGNTPSLPGAANPAPTAPLGGLGGSSLGNAASPTADPGTGLQEANVSPTDRGLRVLVQEQPQAMTPEQAQAQAREREGHKPRELPDDPDRPEGTEPIKAKMVPGLSFPNDYVQPGTTPLTPDHTNPLASEEQKKASQEAADKAAIAANVNREIDKMSPEDRARAVDDSARRSGR